MHGRFAVVVFRVDVSAELHQEVDGFQNFEFCAGLFADSANSDSSGCHNGHAAFGVGYRRIGTQLQQQFHERDIARFRSQQERCCAAFAEHRAAARSFVQTRVDVGSGVNDFSHELETGQPS